MKNTLFCTQCQKDTAHKSLEVDEEGVYDAGGIPQWRCTKCGTLIGYGPAVSVSYWEGKENAKT